MDLTLARKKYEELLQYREQLSNLTEAILSKTVIIRNQKINLEFKEVLPNISVLIPIHFTDMTKNVKKIKYTGILPDYIFTDENNDVTLAFYKTPFPIKNNFNEIDINILDIIKEGYDSLPLKYIAFDSHEILFDNLKIYYFESLIDGIGSSIYNIPFFIVTNQNVFHGAFSFSEKLMYDWREVFLIILKNIEYKLK